MGQAVGVVGMSRDDFLDSTPDELGAIFKAYASKEHGAWERARFLACMSLQPYIPKGKRVVPTDILRFPWEDDQPAACAAAPDLTLEQRKARVALLEEIKNNGNITSRP